MRPDLIGILTGGRDKDASLTLTVNAKVRMELLRGDDREDDVLYPKNHLSDLVE
jgi:hypothetical protein